MKNSEKNFYQGLIIIKIPLTTMRHIKLKADNVLIKTLLFEQNATISIDLILCALSI